jgi:hypothetical protein
LWDAIKGLNAADFSDAALRMLFHVHLMQQRSTTSGASRGSLAHVASSQPAWVTVEARDAVGLYTLN